MNKRDIVNMFEQEYQDSLMEVTSVTDDLADKYVNWLQDKIAQATQTMQPAMQPEETENGK